MSQGAVSGPLAWSFVGDLFLRARVEGLAREAGVAVRFFTDPAALVRELDASVAPPALVVLDLGDRAGRGMGVLAALGARARQGAPPTLAFYSHVDTATKEQALALGATRVVPRSRFMTQFGPLVREVIATAG